MRLSRATLSLGTLLVSVLILLLWNQEPGGSPAPEEPQAPAAGVVEAAAQLEPTDEPEARRVEVEAEAAEMSHAASLKRRRLRAKPRTGFIFGNILDSESNRVYHGQVLVFENQKDPIPVATLELKGTERQYRCELPANRAYYLLADPESLPGGMIPALANPKNQHRRRAKGHNAPKELDRFVRIFVNLPGGEEVRRDLPVGVLAEARGRLLDASGHGISGALARMSAQAGGFMGGYSVDSLTDEEGNFSFAEVFPGEFRLSFSRRELWNPPLVPLVRIQGGESKDFGDIYASGGDKSIRGRIVNQDGNPFPGLLIRCYKSQDWNATFGSARSDESGFFEISGLLAVEGKVSFTSEFEPSHIGGAGSAAYWIPNAKVDLREGANIIDIGTHTVDESRPFEIKGEFLFDGGWLTQEGHDKRPPLRNYIHINTQANTVSHLLETPMTEVEIRFRLKGHEDLVFTVQPEALKSWSREIRVPGDFGPLNR